MVLFGEIETARRAGSRRRPVTGAANGATRVGGWAWGRRRGFDGDGGPGGARAEQAFPKEGCARLGRPVRTCREHHGAGRSQRSRQDDADPSLHGLRTSERRPGRSRRRGSLAAPQRSPAAGRLRAPDAGGVPRPERRRPPGDGPQPPFGVRRGLRPPPARPAGNPARPASGHPLRRSGRAARARHRAGDAGEGPAARRAPRQLGPARSSRVHPGSSWTRSAPKVRPPCSPRTSSPTSRTPAIGWRFWAVGRSGSTARSRRPGALTDSPPPTRRRPVRPPWARSWARAVRK